MQTWSCMCEHSMTSTLNGIRDLFVDYRRGGWQPKYPGHVPVTGGVVHFYYPWQAQKCMAGLSLHTQRNRSMTTWPHTPINFIYCMMCMELCVYMLPRTVYVHSTHVNFHMLLCVFGCVGKLWNTGPCWICWEACHSTRLHRSSARAGHCCSQEHHINRLQRLQRLWCLVRHNLQRAPQACTLLLPPLLLLLLLPLLHDTLIRLSRLHSSLMLCSQKQGLIRMSGPSRCPGNRGIHHLCRWWWHPTRLSIRSRMSARVGLSARSQSRS